MVLEMPRGDDVDAVLVGARAEPALDGLVGHVAPARARIDAAERDDRRGALAAGHHLARARRWPAHPSPCRRRDARSRGWRRRRGRETRAFTTEPFGAVTSMVRQQPELGGIRLLGSTAVLRPQIDARRRHRQRRVDGALDGGIAAGEVDRHAVARLLHVHADPERRVAPSARRRGCRRRRRSPRNVPSPSGRSASVARISRSE